MNKLKEYADEYWDIDYTTGSIKWKKNPPQQPDRVGKEAGYIKKDTSYRFITWGKKSIPSHRVLFALYHGYVPIVVDHIDGNRQNNALDNLRDVDLQDNSRNKKRQYNATLEYLGVAKTPYDKYQAWYYRVPNKRVGLGTYTNIHLAGLVAGVMRDLMGYHKNHGRVA